MHNPNPAESIQERARAMAKAKASGETVVASTMDGSKVEVNPEKCWFCTEADAKNVESHFKIPMYRGKLVGQVKNEKGVMVDQYEWNAIKFPVPRCKDCEGTHHSMPWVRSGPTFAGFLASAVGMFWVLKDHNVNKLLEGIFNGKNTVDLTPILEMITFCVCGMFFCMAFTSYLVTKIQTAVPGELYARNYPVLQKLISDGWHLGKSPASTASAAAEVTRKVA